MICFQAAHYRAKQKAKLVARLAVMTALLVRIQNPPIVAKGTSQRNDQHTIVLQEKALPCGFPEFSLFSTIVRLVSSDSPSNYKAKAARVICPLNYIDRNKFR